MTVAVYQMLALEAERSAQMYRMISGEGREGRTDRRQGERMFDGPSLSTQHQFLLCHLLARAEQAAMREGGEYKVQ